MKIIRQGMIPGDRIHQAECNHCRTLVEFKQSEARRVDDQRDGDFLEIHCPTCPKKITVQL